MIKNIPQILTALLIFLTFVSHAQELSLDEPVAYEILVISGKVTTGEETREGATIELYEQNKVVTSLKTKKNGKFKFTLMSDMIYTIQVTKDGFYTKRISVNTKVPSEIEDYFNFDFDINIDSKTDNNFNPNLVDYPSALISYDKIERDFLYDRDYTKSYFDEIEQ